MRRATWHSKWEHQSDRSSTETRKKPHLRDDTAFPAQLVEVHRHQEHPDVEAPVVGLQATAHGPHEARPSGLVPLALQQIQVLEFSSQSLKKQQQ